MVLDFEYGVNTGNRFLQFVDHDEEPDDFIAAAQVQEEKQQQQQKKSSTKDVKSTTTTKKTTTKTPSTTATTTTTSAKTNKENLTSKTSNVDQRRPQSGNVSAVFTDNNQQTRGARGSARRGGPPFDAAGRGARSQRFNKFEGKGSSNEPNSFEPSGEGWNNESGVRSTRGRGGQRQGNFEGARGLGNRGRGRGGRGNFSNRNEDGTSNDENNNWQQTSEINFDNQDISPTERPFEPDGTRRNTRGSHRPRPNRNFEQEGEGQDYRANRRQYDRQPRSFVSSVKPIEKKDGEGAHNWGNPTENPEEHPVSDEITEPINQTTSTSKGWAEQVDEAEKQMTLDEYKKQIEEKKRAQQDKLPQLKRREAGEGEDPKQWQKFEQEYRKKTGDDDDDDEENVDDEDEEIDDEYEEEQIGKKKIITIPLRFKPIELQRGSIGSRPGQRRPGNRYRSNRDEQQQPATTSPNQGQPTSSPSSQQYDDQQRSYRTGRNSADQRRPNRGAHRQARSNADLNAPALDNPEDFPTLPKQ